MGLVAALAACGGDDSGSHAGDADDADAVAVDTIVAVDTVTDTWVPGELGDPCDENLDCASGWCVPSAAGLVCTSGCENGCPSGWECGQVTNQATDEVYVCIDPTVSLCQPCETDDDCTVYAAGAGHRCLDSGPAGRFCGKSCSVGDVQCPPGFTCEPEEGGEGAEGQCVPETGLATCACNALAEALELATTCRVANGFGVCPGVRWCGPDGLTPCDAPIPAEETCNGADDDCDGETDEGVATGTSCDIVNVYGTCPGTGFCVAGEVQCVGVAAEAEVCDGRDQNCNGEADEGFPDLDDDGIADCVDPDDDGDGTPDDQDCAPKDAAISKTAVERCGNGVDEDCDGLTDEEGATDCQPFYRDVDQDGRGDEDTAPRCLCGPDPITSFTVGNSEDCDDLDEDVHPGGTERCNEKDDDCDDNTDEGVQAPCGGCVNVCIIDNGPGTGLPFTPTGSNSSNVTLGMNGALTLAAGQATGWYRQTVAGWPQGNTRWTVIFVDATLPGSGASTLKIRYRTGASLAALTTASWSPYAGPYPPANFPLLINATAPLIEVELTLSGSGGSVPTVTSLSVLGQQL
ncbi:MAG: hypothetical protein EP329_10385 [Deltaproteobacteria bacterium]|nr:MAG: hypothetical protein EP329_10385 [Deltaproteobacteria bacterium]